MAAIGRQAEIKEYHGAFCKPQCNDEQYVACVRSLLVSETRPAHSLLEEANLLKPQQLWRIYVLQRLSKAITSGHKNRDGLKDREQLALVSRDSRRGFRLD